MTTLWPRQQQAFDFAKNRPASLLAMRMGEGKTAVAIALADYWQADRVLVLCPAPVRAVWRREIAKHAPRPYDVAALEQGTLRDRARYAERMCRDFSKSVIVVANYEATQAWRFTWTMMSIDWDLVILDESHRVQGEGVTTEFVRKLQAKHRLCLSGTPLTQDVTSLWAQIKFLHPYLFPGDARSFRKEYHNQYTIGLHKVLTRLAAGGVDLWKEVPQEFLAGTVNTKELLEKLSSIAFRAEGEMPGLPPLLTECRTFRLCPKARKLYDAIKEGHDEEIRTGNWIDMQGSYGETGRLQQITSGWLPDKDGKPVQVDTGKLDTLHVLLQEAGGEPVVVFCRFVHDLDLVAALSEKMGLRYTEISHRRKDGLTPTGTMPEQTQVNGVQVQAGGEGVDRRSRG